MLILSRKKSPPCPELLQDSHTSEPKTFPCSCIHEKQIKDLAQSCNVLESLGVVELFEKAMGKRHREGTRNQVIFPGTINFFGA